MEEHLQTLMKDAQASKFQPIREACQTVLDILKNKDLLASVPAYELREKCLEPLHLALESKTKRLMTSAVSGIEKILKDERFHSSVELESEDKWLPIQILKTVYSTPNLPEDIQTDVMKLLLKMTFSTSWCMNTRIITQVVQVYIKTYISSSSNLKGIVLATLTQLLGSFVEKLQSAVQEMENAEDDVLSYFNAKGNSKVKSLLDDVVTLLKFLTDKTIAASKAGQNKQAVPLLLEGILAVLNSSPKQLRNHESFKLLVWMDLCPMLMSLLGLPKADTKQKTGIDLGKNIDGHTLSSNMAKVIYSISVLIAKMVGPVKSLRPVLESLFHRILLCSALVNRHDTIKAVKELLSSASCLCDTTVTYIDDLTNSNKLTSVCNDMALVKLIVDAVEDCCHVNDSALSLTCITCISDLLSSVEQMSRGIGIHSNSVKVILDQSESTKGQESTALRQDDETEGKSCASRVDLQSEKEECTKPDKDLELETKSDDVNNIEALQEERLSINGLQFSETKEGENSPKSYQKLVEFQRINGLNDDDEKHSVVDFIEDLIKILPDLLSLTTVNAVDEMLQKFASRLSVNFSKLESSRTTEGTVTVLNADSIYSTSFAALCLNLSLAENQFYQTRDKSLIPFTEKQFIDSILDTDMFLYLSPDWLSSVYKHILGRNVLAEAGWTGHDDVALITALKDLDGLGSHAIGGQMLRDSGVMEEIDTSDACSSQLIKAGKLLGRRILSTCWDSIFDVLSSLLNGKSAMAVSNVFAIMIGMEGAKEESLRKKEALCKSLDGLQTAAKLCCSLGLQERCEGVFAVLANTSCVMQDFIHANQAAPERSLSKSPMMPQFKAKLVRLHAAHVLSMDAMMTTGLEIGSHSSNCWKQVFRCCAFISELEHTYFSSGNNQSNLPRIQHNHLEDVAVIEQNDDDMYDVLVTPSVPVAPRINVPNLIKQSCIESGWDRSFTGIAELNSTQASQALCGLSQEVDRFFEEAANRLNMSALTAFLISLCECSKHQLNKMSRRLLEEEENPVEHCNLPPVNSLHLYRLQTVLTKVANSHRPLIHLIKAWSGVSSYLVECAGHKDRNISKMAVNIVHDFVIAVMSDHVELQHFHTNEMLCKTFENILCLELCDGDVQDQIVCSICELVEASATDIKSGWRPLFGALRAVRIDYTAVEEIDEARQRHVEAVLDVFYIYLNTDNIQVFASAMVDCILCLLKYVKGIVELDDSDTDDSELPSDCTVSTENENLSQPALQYLKQCSVILQSMWKMPACPVFHGAKRIQVNTSGRNVDPYIPNMNFKKFAKYFTSDDSQSTETVVNNVVLHEISEQKKYLHITEEKGIGDSASLLSNDSGIVLGTSRECQDTSGSNIQSCQEYSSSDVHSCQDTSSTDVHSCQDSSSSNVPLHQDTSRSNAQSTCQGLEELDNHTGILHVWFLMLEGLSGAISSCPRSIQPQTMETLFEILRSASVVPGLPFVVYNMNHLLFPMIQSWLRSGTKKYAYWETGATNFKQCCGHTTDMVVELIHQFKGSGEELDILEKLLKQLLIVLTECVAQPFEVISRLGCSCIRHILLSAYIDFTPNMWSIVIDNIQNALDITTYCLRQLMLLFKANSENFYGDTGQVKVATRKDLSMLDFYRIWHLAQQVFLLDSQMNTEPPVLDNAEDRSYVFLLYPPGYENSLNPDHILARVPFRSIVVGLLSHQLLLQTIGCIMLEGHDQHSLDMPGMLSRLHVSHVTQLLDCLYSSYKLACQFDLRPGLKFLVQKVAHTPVAVNLYKQAGASMVFYIHTLIKICANMTNIDKEEVRALITRAAKKSSDTDNTMNHGDVGEHHIISKQNVNVEGQEKVSMNHSEMCSKPEASITEKGDNINGVDEKQSETLESEFSLGKKSAERGENEYLTKRVSGSSIADNRDMFVCQLKSVCDELCEMYVDILYDKSGTSCVDNMANQQLFFLIAQPDDFPEFHHKLDIGQLNSKMQETQAKLQGDITMTTAICAQNEEDKNVPLTVQRRQETESVLPPLSPEHSQAKSKRELRSELDSRVYHLATDKLIKNLMMEYKKHKTQQSMPSFSKIKKVMGEKKAKKKRSLSEDPVEKVIEQQQHTSIIKDSEAHLQSWTELLCTILGLFQQLDDDKFITFLPTGFGSVNHLIYHAQEMRLREELAQWLYRVGRLYKLGPEN